MRNIIAGTLSALTIISFTAAAATAQTADRPQRADKQDYTTKVKAEVVERNAQGKATKVRIGEYIVDVCMDEGMTDGCINPRAAGLNWGNYPAATYQPDDD
ncbi:hypothetical protein LY632_07145 [Erythrobacter sp. SDW2]|uniref:hypothetical protein n=1 Tax=Erythrobacter sp. SDW2 TaxID=2907154 RepID=UPI001F40E2A4|nr:hypothetical protein [Erythrobacter sp. SDW2]UIP08162.1 hypothetical protein LY632_07145 [Erythrobacter sp. SDW2]